MLSQEKFLGEKDAWKLFLGAGLYWDPESPRNNLLGDPLALE